MTKKALNQNAKYVQEFINSIESDFLFNNKPINRFKIVESDKDNSNQDKIEQLSKLSSKINSMFVWQVTNFCLWYNTKKKNA